MKIPRQKITAAQAWQIMQVYLHLGKAASAKLALEYGVSADYGRSHAGELGWHRPRRYTGGGKPSSKVHHNDPRWARAIAVGPVIA